MAIVPSDYLSLFEDIKARIRQAQKRAFVSVNSEMIMMYWDIGRMLAGRQKEEGWGSGVLRRLANDLHNELPEMKGFSERNLKLMVQFYREYPEVRQIGQLPVAQIQWAHNILLIQKIKDLSVRLWYMQKTLEQGWSRDFLCLMIKSRAHERQGQLVSNFEALLPAQQSDLIRQSLKDPYIFDFLTLAEPFHEREMESGLIRHLEKFLLELGQGFAFVGRQYHLGVGEEDFYIDLLFYHLKLRCFVVIDLKKGPFKPEYSGKMNFYCNIVDDVLKHPTDNHTIGLILCQDKDRVLAEYALRGINKPIGVSQYELTHSLPEPLKSALPTIEEIETELGTKKR